MPSFDTYSQSNETPEKIGYFVKILIIPLTKFVRFGTDDTADEKFLLHVHPPNANVIFNFLPESLSFLNWPKLPKRPAVSFHVSNGRTPSVVKRLSVSAQASPDTILPSAFTFQNAYETSTIPSGMSFT